MKPRLGLPLVPTLHLGCLYWKSLDEKHFRGVLSRSLGDVDGVLEHTTCLQDICKCLTLSVFCSQNGQNRGRSGMAKASEQGDFLKVVR